MMTTISVSDKLYREIFAKVQRETLGDKEFGVPTFMRKVELLGKFTSNEDKALVLLMDNIDYFHSSELPLGLLKAARILSEPFDLGKRSYKEYADRLCEYPHLVKIKIEDLKYCIKICTDALIGTEFDKEWLEFFERALIKGYSLYREINASRRV